MIQKTLQAIEFSRSLEIDLEPYRTNNQFLTGQWTNLSKDFDQVTNTDIFTYEDGFLKYIENEFNMTYWDFRKTKSLSSGIQCSFIKLKKYKDETLFGMSIPGVPLGKLPQYPKIGVYKFYTTRWIQNEKQEVLDNITIPCGDYLWDGFEWDYIIDADIFLTQLDPSVTRGINLNKLTGKYIDGKLIDLTV